jgi:hypothetical protein
VNRTGDGLNILCLHGWHSIPGGVKPAYLVQHGHIVINPALDDAAAAAALGTAQVEFDEQQPQVPKVRWTKARDRDRRGIGITLLAFVIV